MDHDQQFKNLILDYPREAIDFFAAPLKLHLPPGTRITPVREEMLKDRFGDRFRELDTPLLVQWPDGETDAVVFDLEEHTNPATFKIESIARYSLDLSELLGTRRVVPVVIFLRRGKVARRLRIGLERKTFLSFRYVSCVLGDLPARRFASSSNIVARLTLPYMAHRPDERVAVFDQAMTGLATLETDWNLQRKYADFVDGAARLTDAERLQWKARHDPEDPVMTWSERLLAEGAAKGKAEGKAEGAAGVLVDLVARGLLAGDAALVELERLVAEGIVPAAAADELRRRVTQH